ARTKLRLPRQLFPKPPLLVADFIRHPELRHDEQIAARPFLAHAATPHAQALAILRAGGNLDVHCLFERLRRHACARHRLPPRKPNLDVQVPAFHVEIRMLGQSDAQIQTPGRPVDRPRLPLAADAQPLSFGHAGRNAHLVSLCFRHLAAPATGRTGTPIVFARAMTLFTSPGAAQRDRPDRSAQGLFQGDQQVRFHVAPAPRFRFVAKSSLAAEALAGPPPRSEELFEKVAKTGPAELELKIAPAPAPLPAARELLPARGRTKFRAGLPMRAKLVIFLPVGRVTQHLVSLVDFFEFLLGLLFVLGDIGMILPRQLAKGLLDLVFTGGPRDTKNFVVIFEFHSHTWRAARTSANARLPKNALGLDFVKTSDAQARERAVSPAHERSPARASAAAGRTNTPVGPKLSR